MNNLTIQNKNSLQGCINLPSDKSITHRALILSAISEQNVLIDSWLQSLDCIATLNALRALHVKIAPINERILQIKGAGLYGLQPADNVIDIANAGTAIRLLTAVLAAQKFDSEITGDASICKRPMARVIEPLTMMGAKINAVNNNFAPLKIFGGQKLNAINYTLPVASAQVKSAILLADLYAQGKSIVTEKIPSRNHTELMLDFFRQHKNVKRTINLHIPGDISSAAFFIVGACIATGSDLVLKNIGINPTRTGIVEILRMMGADIKIFNQQAFNNELNADMRIKSAKLKAIEVPIELVPKTIDEFPALAIAAACATGTTIIRGAQELRYKESDRIAALAAGLTSLGIKTVVYPDGLAITGGHITGGIIDSYGDHRIAMAFAIAGLVAQQPIIVQDTHNIATSFPDFVPVARQAGLLVCEEICYA